MRVMTLRSPRAASSRVELRVGQVGAVQRGPRGKTTSFRDQKAVCGNAKCGVMMEPSPTSPFIVPQANFLLQFLLVPLDDPTLLGCRHQGRQAGIRRKGSISVPQSSVTFRQPTGTLGKTAT